MKKIITLSAIFLLLPVLFFALGPWGDKSPATENYIVIGWNDLGMHCANKTFTNICILPPYNNQSAQVIRVGSSTTLPKVMGGSDGIYMTYEIPGNTYSVGKTDFWSYSNQLFGVTLPNNIGLTGLGLTGSMADSLTYFHAQGIPVTPYTDNNLLSENPYQLTLLKAYNSNAQLIATTQSVIPVSNEISCIGSGCHSSEMNILQMHESVSGFNINNRPIFCATCHADPALGMPGNGVAPKFSQAIHLKHGDFITTDCYKCHPGPNTQCLRDTMHAAGLTCVNCHGNTKNVGTTIENGRTPWLQEPSCGTTACHGPNYAENTGKLFRQSRGHGNLLCSACHGSPHAILPTSRPEDNVQNIALQGYRGTLKKCSVCHGYNPTGAGPHGLHAITAPISGTFNIPGPVYGTIAAAFDDLNANGVNGPATFLIDAGYTETGINLTLTVPTSNPARPITFLKNPSQTGVNPKLIVSAGTSSVTDGGIIIAGTDNVTFDKLDVDASSQNTVEWGYALVKRRSGAPFDGCQYVTINGCRITMNKSDVNSVGIYTGNHIATSTSSLTITAQGDAHNYCLFDNNTISNTCIGIKMTGYNAASPYRLYDQFNEIGRNGKNYISNFGGSSAAAYGIFVQYQDSIKIMNDSIWGGNGSTDRIAGIILNGGTSATAEVAYNTISVTSSATTNKNTYGIWNLLGSTAASNKINIHHNIIRNISCITTPSGPLYGILSSVSADSVKICNNTLTGFTLAGSGTQYAIRADGSANYTGIYNNNLSNLNNTGSGSIDLIYLASSVNCNVYGNVINAVSSNGGSVYGIHAISGTNWNVYRNNIYNLSCTNGTTPLVYGIYNAGATNATIYNNFISDLKNAKATGNPAICAMYLTGGTTNRVFFNTIFMNAASTGASFGTSGIYAGTTPALELRNNIVCNLSTPGSSGMTVAYTRNSNAIASYAASSNNNAFYAGTPGTARLLFYDGTNAIQTLSAYQSLVSPRESASISVNPPFINTGTAPYNLHLQSGISTPFESGGSSISTLPVSSDFDGDSRFLYPGYPDNIGQPATAPDIGADEFAGGLPAKALNLSLFLEGLYDASSHIMRQAYNESAPQFGPGIADQITIELHNALTGAIEYSSVVYLGTNGVSSLAVPVIHNGSYYIYVKHRNSIMTSSVTPVSFTASSVSYAFDGPAKAFGSNLLRMMDGFYVVYGGDANQDGLIDGSDLSPTDNLATLFSAGYMAEDINGDGLIDGTDLSFIDNNSALFVSASLPF